MEYTETKKKESRQADSITGAKTVARVVYDGVKFNHLSELSRQIDALEVVNSSRGQYVFEAFGLSRWRLFFIVGLLLSVVFVVLLVLFMATAFFSETYRSMAGYAILIALGIIVANVFIIRASIKEIRFSNRYGKYYDLLKYRNIAFVEDLAGEADVSLGITVKDIKKAVKNNLIPQGHFGNENNIFITSDSIYQKYVDDKAVYDRYFAQLIAERKRIKSRSKDTIELLENGQRYIEKIHDYNDLIKDKDISLKLDRMEGIVTTIFKEVDINPCHSGKLSLLMSYYLPTTERLLEAYVDIDEKNIKAGNLVQTQKDIANALDSINNAFDNLLGQFYQEIELDIESEISSMEIIMQQEGLQNNDR